MLSCHLIASGMLDGRPPLRIEKNLALQPVGNGLLADSWPVEKGADSPSKFGLASGDINGPPEGGNVAWLHERREYTNRFVNVKPVCVTENNLACTVLQMPVAKRKPQPKVRRVAIPGVDGKTLGQRVAEAMAYEAGRRGIEYRQVDLLEDVNRLYGSPPDDPEIDQQLLSAILRNQVSKSSITPMIARACHVNSIWLARGIGKKTEGDGRL